MNRRDLIKRSLPVIFVLALTAYALSLFIPWWQKRGLSIIRGYQFENVENGSVFDKAAINIGEFKKVILPDNAKIDRMGEHGRIYIFMEKKQGFAGHPSHRMTLLGVRKNMGCVSKIEGDALLVATLGEWDSHIEGGATMKLMVIVPNNVEVEFRKGLSGEDSVGHRANRIVEEREFYEDDRTWKFPARGWTPIPDMPDPDRVAE